MMMIEGIVFEAVILKRRNEKGLASLVGLQQI